MNSRLTFVIVAGKAAYIKAAIGLDLDQPSLCKDPSRNGVRFTRSLYDHLLLVDPSATRQFAGDDQPHHLFIDPLARGF
jgi:hypothetical protein